MAGNFQAETIQRKAFWDCRGIVCIIPTLLQLPEVPHHLQTPALNTHSNSDHSHRDSMSYSFTHTLTLTHILEPCWHHRGRSHNCLCLEKRRKKITDLLQNWPYSAVGERMAPSALPRSHPHWASHCDLTRNVSFLVTCVFLRQKGSCCVLVLFGSRAPNQAYLWPS